MSKSLNSALPSYTTVDNIIALIDTLKMKNGKEDEVKALFGKGNSAYSNSRSALRTFGFIEADNLNFTKEGQEAAYSQGEDKIGEMTKILKNCRPYEIFLLSLLKNGSASVTTIDDITNFWGKASYGSTQRNREDAAKLFMSIIDYCEFGKYVIGRGNNATRIEWSSDIIERIKNLNNDSNNVQEVSEEKTISSDANENLAEQEPEMLNEAHSAINEETVKGLDISKENLHTTNTPNITINVDMSEWSDDRMEAFFRYAHGKFKK